MGKIDHTLIFVVDDDKAFCMAAKKALESKRFINLRIYNSGEEALEDIQLKPQVLLLDLRLERDKMDGLEVLKEFGIQSPQTKIIFLTTVDNLEIATQAIKKGAYDYIVKNESAFERVKNLLRRITFENQIMKENILLRRSRRIVILLTALVILAAAVLLYIYL